MHTDRLIERTHSHMYSTRTVQMQTYSHPAWDHCSSCGNYRGGHMCHKCNGSCRQIALLPEATVSAKNDTLHDSGSLFCVCRHNCDNISFHRDWLEWWKLWSHDDRYWFGLKFSGRWYATKFRWLLPASWSLISVTLLSRFSQSHYLRRKWHDR